MTKTKMLPHSHNQLLYERLDGGYIRFYCWYKLWTHQSAMNSDKINHTFQNSSFLSHSLYISYAKEGSSLQLFQRGQQYEMYVLWWRILKMQFSICSRAIKSHEAI